MNICPICGNFLIWQCDYDLEDTHSDLAEKYNGISSLWLCGGCDVLFDYVHIETEKGLVLGSIFLYDENEEDMN